MDAALLSWSGQALFGLSRWKEPLRDDLGVSDRTFRRWLSGSDPVPDKVGAEVFEMLEQRRAMIDRLLAQRD